MKKLFVLHFAVSLFLSGCKTAENKIEADGVFQETHRPQFHFSPEKMWMNDPNGMVYHQGEYHLFYQHYPEGMVWGPMHWGHAVSTDLLHWQHLPIALYPDSLGMIFSGSAVVDERNTSGLGTQTNPALVAIFTYHDMDGEKRGSNTYQTQGIAYSLDRGRTWTKYKHNPVLANPGIKDFRDPKVIWHEPTRKWIMILAVSDHVEFYGSPDLKSWNKLSEFGRDYGGHGGVWECPDLFELPLADGRKKWVMLLSINPGGPNEGSATQYFTGDFDGTTFVADGEKSLSRWVDYGADNYAGVTWSGVPPADGRRIFLGWMSNWNYANAVPTSPWRSAMTVPRVLALETLGDMAYLKSIPVMEIDTLVEKSLRFGKTEVLDFYDLSAQIEFPLALSVIEGTVTASDFEIELSNLRDQLVKIGFDKNENRFYVDRSRSGQTGFSEKFNGVSYAPRISQEEKIRFTVVADVASVEVFFDGGLSVLTNIFFPDEKFNRLKLYSGGVPVIFDSLQVKQLRSVW